PSRESSGARVPASIAPRSRNSRRIRKRPPAAAGSRLDPLPGRPSRRDDASERPRSRARRARGRVGCCCRGPDGAACHEDVLESRVAARDPVLVALRPAEEAVLARPVAERLPERVREDDQTDGRPLPFRIAAALVVRLDPGEAEAVPSGRRALVDLEEPEPQPTALERPMCERTVELAVPCRERGAGPPRRVQGEERLEIGIEPRAVACKPVRDPVLAGELALVVTDLVSQARA